MEKKEKFAVYYVGSDKVIHEFDTLAYAKAWCMGTFNTLWDISVIDHVAESGFLGCIGYINGLVRIDLNYRIRKIQGV